MKIMIHSNGPMVPSGYGRQTALAIRQLAGLGHEVAVSAFHGVTGSIVDWNGIPIYPSGITGFGLDTIVPHAQHFGADLLLTLMDAWKLAPAADQLVAWQEGGGRLACWMPVDCSPLGQGDRQVLRRTKAIPIAMSRFGERQLVDAGLTGVRYIPHSVDTAVYRPDPDGRRELRGELGVAGDRFIIGICAANRDAIRKAWPEQFRAFDLHRRTHPDSLLLVHTIPLDRKGFDLAELATDMGIADAVRFTDVYPQVAGLIDDADMALWYNALDLLSNCSYAEGFGLPILESQACGVPAVGTGGSAMSELASELVDGEQFWNPVHRAWWTRPVPERIAAAYSTYRETVNLWRPEIYVERARHFGVDEVTANYWAPFLDDLGASE